MAIAGDDFDSENYARSIARRAAIASTRAPAGPVHINFPFREPLVPSRQDAPQAPAADDSSPQIVLKTRLSEEATQRLAGTFSSYARGVIVCGPQDDPEFPAAIVDIAFALGYPVLADPLSQLRTGSHDFRPIIDNYDVFLRHGRAAEALRPEIVIRFGLTPTSKPLMSFLGGLDDAEHFLVDAGGGWIDPLRVASEMIEVDPTSFARDIAGAVRPAQRDRVVGLSRGAGLARPREAGLRPSAEDGLRSEVEDGPRPSAEAGLASSAEDRLASGAEDGLRSEVEDGARPSAEAGLASSAEDELRSEVEDGARPSAEAGLASSGDGRSRSELEHGAGSEVEAGQRSEVEASVDGGAWLGAWRAVSTCARLAVAADLAVETALSEPKVFEQLGERLPADSLLYVGNSMPVRDLDDFFGSRENPVRILGNRGVNGIDGVVSSALGAGAALGSRVVLVIGDLSFYHDMNGLLAAKLHSLDATIILVNNDGGGIFNFLPQAEHPETFERFFGTPTGLDFRAGVEMYGGRFYRPNDWAEFHRSLDSSTGERGLSVIEVRIDRAENARRHAEIWDSVKTALDQLSPHPTG
jgi:2-succinyl-5-enolpyruvyl-6-hydroxy-3-cyclohexene-1-carboxylate synthase